jgi:hypothetical protein
METKNEKKGPAMFIMKAIDPQKFFAPQKKNSKSA